MNQIESQGNRLLSLRYVLIIIFVAIAVFLLLTEHRSHILNILPYLLLLACPFMHFFMHGRHGKQGSDGGSHH